MNLLLKIGLDTGSADGSIAWALDYPGCFANGKDGSEAILNMPRAFLQYCDWTVKHSPTSWLANVADFDLRLVETFECYSITQDFERTALVETQYLASPTSEQTQNLMPQGSNWGASPPPPDQTIRAGDVPGTARQGKRANQTKNIEQAAHMETQDIASLQTPKTYEVGSFFLHDWKPLTTEDVRRGLLLLEWSRSDLLGILSGLSPDQRAQTYPGERWSIDGILKHVGGAEWWYMDNIGMAGLERAQVSDAPDERLAQVRARLRQLLPALVGVSKVVGRDGELWSPRKVLRRALWHERDHTGHILKLI